MLEVESLAKRLAWNTDRETQLKKLWNAVKSGRPNSCVEKCEVEGPLKEDSSPEIKSHVCSGLLLPTWPSHKSLKRGTMEETSAVSKEGSLHCEDSGIESIQVSPSPVDLLKSQSMDTKTSPPRLNDNSLSRTHLHPDHAKLMMQRPEQRLLLHESTSQMTQNGGFIASPLSSSAASSITSITGGPTLESHSFDFRASESRRSSTLTNKYSLLDALDLEYALIKAAARESVGQYGLSQSLQKLTFTQSLAFPALARGLSNKRNSTQSNTKNTLDSLESGVSAFAKVATVMVLVVISVLVFGVLYKFIRT